METINAEFNFEIWKMNITQLFSRSSYMNLTTQAIRIFYHEWIKDKHLAFRTLVHDVNHECLHVILLQLENKETSKKYDKIAQTVEKPYFDKDTIEQLDKIFGLN